MAVQQITYGNLTWIDIPQFTLEDVEYLEDNFPFHPLDFEDLASRLQRPKLDEYDDYLFLVLHFPVFDKELRVTQPNEIYLFVGSNYIITLHKRKVWPLERFFEACSSSDKVQQDNMGMGAGYLLYRIMDKIVDNFFPILYKIERNVQDIEDMIFERGGRETVEEISLLRRDIIAFRRIVKPQITIITRLEHIKSRIIAEDLDIYFSDIGDALARIGDSIEDQKNIIESLNDTHDSLISHRTNDVIKVLTIISVIMLPLTLVSGIYGMNVPLPGQENPFSFEFILALMLAIALSMLGFFRYRRWI